MYQTEDSFIPKWSQWSKSRVWFDQNFIYVVLLIKKKKVKQSTSSHRILICTTVQYVYKIKKYFFKKSVKQGDRRSWTAVWWGTTVPWFVFYNNSPDSIWPAVHTWSTYRTCICQPHDISSWHFVMSLLISMKIVLIVAGVVGGLLYRKKRER